MIGNPRLVAPIQDVLSRSSHNTITGANHTATSDDYVIFVDCSGANRDVDLPAASTVDKHEYFIKKTDSGAYAVKVNPNGSDTIEGQVWVQLSEQYQDVCLFSDGSNWIIKHLTGGLKWTPTQLTTAAWYDAEDTGNFDHVSNSVSQWDDMSGNGHHVTQLTGANQPTINSDTQNSKNVVTFDGNDFLQNLTANISTQPTSVFAVASLRATGLSGRNYVFDGLDNNANRNLFALDGNNTDLPSIWAGTWLPHTDSTDANYHVFECFYDGTSSVIGIDADRVTGTANTSGNLDAGLTIGANYTESGDFLDGYIAELIFIDGELSVSNRQKLEGYLAHKWGLTANLDSSHPYKTF